MVFVGWPEMLATSVQEVLGSFRSSSRGLKVVGKRQGRLGSERYATGLSCDPGATSYTKARGMQRTFTISRLKGHNATMHTA